MDIYVALVHHPVRNRNGDVVTTAVTNLDIHDLARASRTYDVRGMYIVTPLEQQFSLVSRIVEHWQEGDGIVFGPERLPVVQVMRSADGVAGAAFFVDSARLTAVLGPPESAAERWRGKVVLAAHI